MSAPDVSVVIPAHRRPMRLRWLLNALEEQTLAQSRFEAIVAHDSDDVEVERVARTHPLAAAGVLRSVACPPTIAAVKRNAGWRAARAPLIAFTDDDCRPPEDWLERVLSAARTHPGAVVQGRTTSDPDERDVELAAPWVTTQRVEPPHRAGQTCNIVYPRELLERVGGFDERRPLTTGEDSDLLRRAIKSGAAHVGAPEVLTYHAVEARTLLGRIRLAGRWGDLPELVRRHPEFRRQQPLRIFWKPSHPRMLLAAAGVGVAAVRREPWWALLAVPWVRLRWPRHGRRPRGVIRSLSELPGRAAIDAAEIAVLARGSIRHRTLFL